LGREEPVNDGPAALLRSRTGEEFAIEQAASPVRRESGKLAGVVVVFRDVSEGRRAAQQMAWQATHDALTGLYNRHEFEHRLRRLLAQHSEPARQHAMLYLDLDQFKIVNDTCGHQAGDELLRQLTGLLAAETRDADTLARLGGDEFGVILTDCPLRDARRVAEKLIGVIQDFRFVWRERQFSLGASVGVVAVDSTQSLAGLMSAADSACYAAKEKGRNRVRVYHPEDRDLAQRHDEMTWVSRLNAALEDDRFVLYCQRIDPLGRGARGPGVCWELLLRMRDEEGRIVMPGSFIAAAERYGVMPAVDRWVIRRVFNALADRHKRGTGHPADMFCINVSGTTLSEEDFVAFVTGCFREYGVNPASICFEITETAAIANLSEASEFIDQVRALGASISLDDFGAGLSSFTYLKTLHADRMKIDGAFVKDMARDPVDCAMVETIHRVGRIMGIETVAEYVESSDILAHLRRIGVDYAQGYAIHRPEPWWGDPDNRDPEVASEAGD
jgi:diguanylate cyclase (GGDEF)-like protein